MVGVVGGTGVLSGDEFSRAHQGRAAENRQKIPGFLEAFSKLPGAAGGAAAAPGMSAAGTGLAEGSSIAAGGMAAGAETTAATMAEALPLLFL